MARRTLVRRLGVVLAAAAVFAVVSMLTAAAAPVTRVSPTGTIHDSTPTIVAHLSGTISSGWTLVYYPPINISVVLDGQPMSFTRDPVDPAAMEVTVTVQVTEPLDEGLHAVEVSYTNSSGVRYSDYWTFEYVADAGATPSQITDVWPVGETSRYVWDNKVRFAVSSGDIDPATAVATLTVDGTVRPVSLTAGYYTSAALTLGYGPHTVTAVVTDGDGSRVERSWAFSKNTAPVVSALYPADGSRAVSVDTSFTAAATDDSGGIDLSATVMRVNGAVVPYTYTPTGANGGTFSYVPSTPLPAETTITASLRVVDVYGAFTERTWSFDVTRYSDMAPGAGMSPAICKTCHGSDFNALHLDQNNISLTHRVLPTTGILPDGYANCIYCHQTLDTVVNDPGLMTTHDYSETQYARRNDPNEWCAICHRNVGALNPWNARWNWQAHGKRSDFTWTQLPAGAAVTAPREAMDCIYCHQKGSAAPRTYGPHDTLTDHEIGLPASCQACHSDVLTWEHAAEGRLSGTGEAIGCVTCHESADATVRGASGKQWTPEVDRWVASDGFMLHPYSTTPRVFGPWSYQRGGQTVPVKRVKVDIKGSAGVVVAAYYGGAWHDVLTIANWNASYPSTYMIGANTVLNPDSVRFLDLPGATAFKVTISTAYNMDMEDGARVGITVMDTDPARAEVTCHTCHEGADHLSLHDSVMQESCVECHDANIQTEHLSGQGLMCDTCHESTDATVLAAIEAGGATCETCHEGLAHTSLHESRDFDESCADCHEQNLVTEHVSRRGMTCDHCHGDPMGGETSSALGGGSAAASSADSLGSVTLAAVTPQDLADALASGDTYCGACHADPHPGIAATWGLDDYYSWESTSVHGDPLWGVGANPANPGVHANYLATTAKCGICHSVHRANPTGVKLLDTATATCAGCHRAGVSTVTTVLISWESGGPHNSGTDGSCLSRSCHAPNPHGVGTSSYAIFAAKLIDGAVDSVLETASGPLSNEASSGISAADLSADASSTWSPATRSLVVSGYTCAIDGCHTQTMLPVIEKGWAERREDRYPLGDEDWVARTGHMTSAEASAAHASYVPVSDCESCHDQTDAATRTGFTFPHSQTPAGVSNLGAGRAYLWMGYAGSAGETLQAVPTGGKANDGTCLKCHRDAGGTVGVGVDR